MVSPDTFELDDSPLGRVNGVVAAVPVGDHGFDVGDLIGVLGSESTFDDG